MCVFCCVIVDLYLQSFTCVILFFSLLSMVCILICVCIGVFFFFFKQKTAYEMRISDWSSDVCSSDLNYPRDGYTMVKMGTAAAELMKRDFIQKYPDGINWPPSEAAMFQHWQELNEIAFSKASKLGWEPPREMSVKKAP